MTGGSEECILRALDLARKLTLLADQGELSGDDECAVLCGIVRDCAYKIRRHAEVGRDRRRSGMVNQP